jgi:hypothetical protein
MQGSSGLLPATNMLSEAAGISHTSSSTRANDENVQIEDNSSCQRCYSHGSFSMLQPQLQGRDMDSGASTMAADISPLDFSLDFDALMSTISQIGDLGSMGAERDPEAYGMLEI